MFVAEDMYQLGSQRSAIRELFEYGARTAALYTVQMSMIFPLETRPSVCIDHHMMRAVHRTKNERLSLHLHWWEHVFFVVIPVTGCLVQIYGTDTRSHNMPDSPAFFPCS